ncbi:class F sortase [Thermomonospora umbrina]|uniref:Sortase family protein n=1 Tax=Thermomonospora umbrina TaxID=111806 RepID=A0A3D9SXK5_9ACTN|nr:class F sortase [Thermomonospora umbrina]REE98783.1 sortase family protein [Thermomonospora umbrina]
MPRRPFAGGGRDALIVAAALGLALTTVLATACGGGTVAEDVSAPAAEPVTHATPPTAPDVRRPDAPAPGGSGPGGPPPGAGRPAADPVRLRIPAIGVSTRVIPLGLDRHGRLIAPTRFDVVGWNRAGPEPGEPGNAVIAGHVDSHSGPAVFYRLRRMRVGDRVHVDRADGTSVVFMTHRLARFPKRRVPDAEVYGGDGRSPGLRLITCAGSFDRSRRSYRDNLIVFLTPTNP